MLAVLRVNARDLLFELAGRNPTILYHLGMTYYKLGRRDEAASTFRRALQQQETIPQAAEMRSLLEELKK